MNVKNVIATLKKHSFLAGMSDEYLEFIADCSEEKQFDNGQFLMRFQQTADEFYLLLDGRVVLLNHVPGRGVDPLETLSAPSVLGWSWLMSPYRWHFDVKATEEVKAICVHAMCLRGKMQADPVFGCEMYSRFMTVIVDRLQAARLQGMDVYGKPEGASL